MTIDELGAWLAVIGQMLLMGVMGSLAGAFVGVAAAVVLDLAGWQAGGDAVLAAGPVIGFFALPGYIVLCTLRGDGT